MYKQTHFASVFCFFKPPFHSCHSFYFCIFRLQYHILFTLPEYFQIVYNYFETNRTIRLKINASLNHPNIYSSVYNHSSCQENTCFLRGFYWLTADWRKKAIHIQLMVSIGYVNTLNFYDNVTFLKFNDLFDLY